MSRRDPQGLGYDPTILRTLVDAYNRMLAELNAMRRESETVAELLALATITDEIHTKRESCHRRLDRIESQRFTEAKRDAFLASDKGHELMASLPQEDRP